jgi:rSAM/selenodomain-associated transferase 2
MRCSFSLSIIVPVLNEAERLPGLFAYLGRQQGVSFELIISDGGSADETVESARRLAEKASFPCHIIQGSPGRGRQLNAGAQKAGAPTLLFLHVDSSFADPQALATAVAALERAIAASGNEALAGHFALRFRRRDPDPSLAYYYYEAKACLNRPGCIHGDQGFLLRKTFFEQVGPFDQSLGFLEDDRLASAIFRTGRWLLLPARLETSARRFDQEGLYARQVLNAVIVALEAAGRDDFLRALPALYRQQRCAEKLRLRPIFVHIRYLLRALPAGERRQFWKAVGQLLVRNLWQLFLLFDARKGFRLGTAPEQLPPRLLVRYDKQLKKLAEKPLGYCLGSLSARLWFLWQLRWRLPEKGGMC